LLDEVEKKEKTVKKGHRGIEKHCAVPGLEKLRLKCPPQGEQDHFWP